MSVPEGFGRLILRGLVPVVAGMIAGGLFQPAATTPLAYVWPVAGVAIAILLLWDRRLWPAVLLGAFAFYCGGADDGRDFALAVLYAGAVGIQASATTDCLRWLYGRPISLRGARDIVVFAVLVGPIGGAVAPAILGFAAVATGFATIDFAANPPLILWLGHAAGTLTVVTTALFVPRRSAHVLWKGEPLARPAWAMFAGMALLTLATLTVWHRLSVEADERAQATFEALVDDSYDRLRSRLAAYGSTLDATAGFALVADPLTGAKWESFVRSLGIGTSLPGLGAIGFVEPVAQDELAAFAARARSRGVEPSPAHPTSIYPEKFLLALVAPQRAYPGFVGRDLGAAPSLRQAAVAARRTGLMTMTRRVPVQSDGVTRTGFVLLRPVYEDAARRGAPAGERGGFVGWVSAPLILERFMADIVQTRGAAFSIAIAQVGPDAGEAPFYPGAASAARGADPVYRARRDMRMFQQGWTIVWTSTPAFERGVVAYEPLMAAFGGMILTLLFGGLLSITGQRQTVIDREVTRKTDALSRALDALNESEARYVSLANATPAGIFRTDAAGALTYVNPTWCALTGVAAANALNGRWGDAIEPEDLEPTLLAWTESVTAGAPFRAELRCVHADGRRVWVDAVGRPERDETGALTGFIGALVDITDRKTAEAQLAERDAELRVLATNANDAVLRLTLGGRCFYASPSTADVLHLPPALLLGRTIFDAIHTDDVDMVRKAFDELASGGRERKVVACRARTGPSQVGALWLEANAAVVHDAAGERREIIASIRDITHRKTLEFELVEARHTAEAAASAKSAFLANMSHEIRTPMNAVIGFTDLLMQGEQSDEQRRFTRLIADSGRAMMQLLNDILDVSKIEAGQMKVIEEAFDLHHKLKGAVDLMGPMAREKGLDLTLTIDADVPAHVLGDSLRVRQILVNLIGNAVKFTETGSVRVEASLEGSSSKPDDTALRTLRIDVRDTGIGIAPDRLAAIFEGFTQAEKTTAKRYGGTGLGLTISARLAQMMQGSLTVASERGVGSVFSFVVPVRPAAEPIARKLRPSMPAGLPTPGSRAIPVLVAEDYDVNQVLIASMASRLGLDAKIVANGREAVDSAVAAARAGQPFRLVLMDMQMPVMGGLDATRALRAGGLSPADLPIVALTANAYAEDVQACLDAGMQAHLAKPLRLAELAAVVTRWCAGAPVVDGTDAAEAPETATQAATDAQPGTAQASRPAAKPGGALADKHRRRRDETLAVLARLADEEAPGEEAVAALADSLHKLAGTAGFFGEAGLGGAAREVEVALRSAMSEAERSAALRDGLDRLTTIQAQTAIKDE